METIQNLLTIPWVPPVLYVLGGLLGLSIFYIVVKNAVKNGILQANLLIRRRDMLIPATPENPDPGKPGA